MNYKASNLKHKQPTFGFPHLRTIRLKPNLMNYKKLAGVLLVMFKRE